MPHPSSLQSTFLLGGHTFLPLGLPVSKGLSELVNGDQLQHHCDTIGVFTLVTRVWAASEFLTLASKVNMTPNGEHQIIRPDRSHIFDARVKNFVAASPM